MKRIQNPFCVAGFLVASSFALKWRWSLAEFCWSTWVAGLVYAWACILSAVVRIIFMARSNKSAYEARFSFLHRVHPLIFLFIMVLMSIAVGYFAFRIATFVFAFYGLFLSFFAEMRPFSLFGRNGFINSDFFTPVVYLFESFWPMVVGVLIAEGDELFGSGPLKYFVLRVQKEILRQHCMIIALPLFAILAWFLFREAYQPMSILLLMGLLYFMPRTVQNDSRKIDAGTGQG